MSAREMGKSGACIPTVKFAFFAFTFQYYIDIPQLVLLRSSKAEYLGQLWDEKRLREFIFLA